MFILCSQLFRIAWNAREKAREETSEVNPWSPDATVAIIMSAAAAEGFINELAELASLWTKNSEFFFLAPPARAFADAYKEVERCHGSIQLKYLIASQLLSGRMFDKGALPFQDFDTLIKLRNDHMHLKPQDGEPVVEDGRYLIKPPRYIQTLANRGLAWDAENVCVSWLQRVQTAKMAEWACQTALDMILAILEMLPDGPHQEDVGYSFKQLFRFSADLQQPWSSRAAVAPHPRMQV